MQEIQKEEYARTKKGYIAQVKEVNDIEIIFDSTIDEVYGDKREFIFIDDIAEIKKHSKNIIDLLEAGDYINGHLIEKIYRKEKYAIYYEFLEIDDDVYEVMEMCELENIKSICTKEQFEQAEYRIKE